MPTEERRKPSVFVGEPEIQREMPSFFAGVLSVFGQDLSEFAELPFVFVGMLSVFGRHPCEFRRMLHSFPRDALRIPRAPL
jgi:hypothetical protein